MNTLAGRLLAALTEVLGERPVALHEPSLNGKEKLFLSDCVDSTFVSSIGPYVERFESDLVQFTGSPHAVATVNGTSALHIALLLAGVKPGDEVLVPALSFVASANAVRYCGAVPHFLDSEEATLGLDPSAMLRWLQETCNMVDGDCINTRTGRRVSAVVPMHTFGHPCDIAGIIEVATEYGFTVVEDAAESLGSWVGDQHTGTFGLLGILSFNGNKIVTTGGGGAILTKDANLAHKARHLTTTAKVPHGWKYVHDEVGFNYRMPNINAALGCAQMEEIESFISSKRRLYKRYREILVQAELEGIKIFGEPAGTRSNYWLQTLILDRDLSIAGEEIIETLNKVGIMARPAWNLLPTLRPFLDCPQAPLPVAESLAQRIVNIPSSAGLA
jgi:aminotransferase in exopolysaccharide biosynthesis